MWCQTPTFNLNQAINVKQLKMLALLTDATPTTHLLRKHFCLFLYAMRDNTTLLLTCINVSLFIEGYHPETNSKQNINAK